MNKTFPSQSQHQKLQHPFTTNGLKLTHIFWHFVRPIFLVTGLFFSVMILQAQKSVNFLSEKSIVKNKFPQGQKQVRELCTDSLYTIGCSWNDGVKSWYLSNILIPGIPCSDWYHDYTDLVHELAQGYHYTIKTNILIGTYFDIWIDLNNDLNFTDDELVLDDAYNNPVNQTNEFELVMPTGLAVGEHIMRVRTSWSSPVTDPCETYTFGNCCDFKANVGGIINSDVGVINASHEGLIQPGSIAPQATIKNFGYLAQSFEVTITDNVNYSSTRSVIELAPGEVVQLTFDDWIATYGNWYFETCTHLTEDEIPENDCYISNTIVQGSKTAYGYLAFIPGGAIPVGPVSFDLLNPGSINSLAPTTSSDFLSCACIAPGGIMYAIMWGGGLYEVDYSTGALNYIGNSPSCNGLAHDGQTLYGVSSNGSMNFLYKINPGTGETKVADTIFTQGNLLVSIDCDNSGNMYGYDIVDDFFYSINKNTGEATMVGPLGFDFNYSQDMYFDKSNNVCFIAGYTNSGALYTVNLENGKATLYQGFENGAEITAFAIPGSYGNFSHDVGVAAVTAPKSGIYLGENEIIIARLINNGNTPQSGFQVSYAVNGGEPVVEIFLDTLQPNGNAYFSFETGADLSIDDMEYHIEVCTLLGNDENSVNNCNETVVKHYLNQLPAPANLSGEAINNQVYLWWNTPNNNNLLFQDEFEQYNPGDFVALNNPAWTTWTNQPGSVEDARVSSEQCYSPVQSMKCDMGTDIILLLGNKLSGKYEVSQKLFVPQDSNAIIITFQHFDENQKSWGSQLFFNNDGTGYIDAGIPAAASFTFNFDTWMNVKHFINLDEDIAELWIDNELIHNWQWSLGPLGGQNLCELGALDFFQNTESSFFVDEVIVKQVFPENLLGYDIFRDEEFLAFTTDTNFIDETPTLPEHEYCVETVYDVANSKPACVTVDISTNITETHPNKINVFPNPAHNQVNIMTMDYFQQLSIFNHLGQELFNSGKIETRFYTLDIRNFKPGIYLIQIGFPFHTLYSKLIISSAASR